jgi:hypothetical protein
MEAMEERPSQETFSAPDPGESSPVDSGDPLAESPAAEFPTPELSTPELSTPADLLAGQWVAPPPDTPAKESAEMPMMVLIEAGLTVFDGVLVVIFAVLWKTNPDILLQLMEGRAGIALLLGAAPVILGAVISKRNEKSGTEMTGSIWARVGLIVGTLMCLMTLAIPVLATIRAMLQPI